jgi:hypothetical protein
MSGTRIRTFILHVCPESRIGGRLASVVRRRTLFVSIRKAAPSICPSNRKSSRREGLLGVRQSRTYPWLRRTVLPARHPGGRGMRFRFSSASRNRCRSRGSLTSKKDCFGRARRAASPPMPAPFSGHTNGGYPQLDHARRNLRRCLPNYRRYAQKHEQRR